MAKKKFDYRELGNLTIGALEGESDNFLKMETFIITSSIFKILTNDKYNYIIGEFGSGKSAFFKALQEKYIIKGHKDLNNKFFSNKNIICLNKSFQLDSNVDREDLTADGIILNWSVYLLKIFISDIFNKYSDRKGFADFKKRISFYEEFKNDSNLNGFKTWVEQFSISPTITVSGVPISLGLNLKNNSEQKKINLNELFQLVDNFYKENELKSWILIDRIDDFVRFDNYEKRKIYIQGLHELIEEIRTFSSLRPMLFLRKDLFETIKFSTGSMKVKDRTVYLKWTQEEILNFLCIRLIETKVFNIYNKELNKIITSNTNNSLFKIIKKIIATGLKKIKVKKDRKYRSFEHKVVKELLYFILPPFIKINKKEIEFEEMLEQYLINKDFVNPRIIICFMNKLNEEQYNYYRKNPPKIINKKFGQIKKIKEYNTINVYSNVCIKESLNYTKSLLQEHIIGLFPDSTIDFKKYFLKLNDIIQKKYKIKEETIFEVLKNEGLKVSQINSIIHFLKVIGFFDKKGKIYVLTNLYKKV